jgi:hypothetical protein
MAGYSTNAVQTVNPGETVVFTTTDVACNRGFVRHRNGTGNFLLAGYVPMQTGCCCNRQRTANYFVDFAANIAVPTGETVGPISLAISIDGATDPTSTMIVTPAAVEQFFNVSRAIYVDIFKGCCESVAVRNTSSIPILVENANIVFSRPDLYTSR